MKKLLCLLFLLQANAIAQTSFGERCLGTWKGTMYIYGQGTLRDSVKVVLTVAPTQTPTAWTWHTQYLSEKMPMTKNYILRLKDAAKQQYVTDEGNDILLDDYLFGNKIYCVFETSGYVLTSSYELVGNSLIFEVTSGKKPEPSHKPVVSYPITSLQRVVLRRD